MDMDLAHHCATQRAMSSAQAAYDAQSEPEAVEDELSDTLDAAIEELHFLRTRLDADRTDAATRNYVAAEMRRIADWMEGGES